MENQEMVHLCWEGNRSSRYSSRPNTVAHFVKEDRVVGKRVTGMVEEDVVGGSGSCAEANPTWTPNQVVQVCAEEILRVCPGGL